MSDLDIDLAEQLIAAAKAGDLPMVQAALANGADVNAREGLALRCAAESGHVAVIKLLRTAGANIPAFGTDKLVANKHALALAAENSNTHTVDYLISEGAEVLENADRELWETSLNGYAGVARVLLERRASAGCDMASLPLYASDVQVALLAAGDVSALSVPGLAHLGACPEALSVLLERQGHGHIAAMLQSTQVLEPLTPEARAELLEYLQAKHPPMGNSLVNP